MNDMANLEKVDVPNKNQKRKLWLMFIQLVPAGYVRNDKEYRRGDTFLE